MLFSSAAMYAVTFCFDCAGSSERKMSPDCVSALIGPAA